MLPANYKQNIHNFGSHVMSPGHAPYNILKERLRPSGGGSSDRKDMSPFIHSPYGNPSFTPQKLGKAGSSSDSRSINKPPKAPEKPLMPYMRYSRKVWDDVKAANPELKLWNIGKLISQMWKELPDSKKQAYIEEYDVEKAQYTEALRAYKSTPEYLAWDRNKKKMKATSADTDNHDAPRSSSKGQSADRRIDIQPAEDEEDQDDGYSFKHVAYARYLRNHRLINEIFSESIVPDVRSVVTTQRMHVLKRQVQSLAMHQMKLQAELQQIEEKFETKKRKFVESSDLFQEELKKHCKPAVDEEAFHKMVERQYDMMKRERVRSVEEQAKKPEEQQPPQPQVPQQQHVAPNANTAQPAPTPTGGSPSEQQPAHEPMEVDHAKKAEDIEESIKPSTVVATTAIEKPVEVTPPPPPPKPVEVTPPAPEPIVEKPKEPEPVHEPAAAAPVMKPAEPEAPVVPPPPQQHAPAGQPPMPPQPVEPKIDHPAATPPLMPPGMPAAHPEPPIAAPNVTVASQPMPGPPGHHMPPHMPQHAGAMPHAAYGNYPGGPPRPYYMPYGSQYQGYPYPYHHQQYAPQYGPYGVPQQGPPPSQGPGMMPHGMPPQQQQQQQPPPPLQPPSQQPPVPHPPATGGQEENKGGDKGDADKKESSE